MSTTTDAATGADPVPLVALLARAEAAFTAEFDRRLLASEFCALSLAHARNVLRHLGDGPQRAARLAELTGVSKQAISQQVVQLERDGYVRSEPDPCDQRARLVALTDRGLRARAQAQATAGEIEEEWAARLGGDALSGLRATLGAVLEGDGARRSEIAPHTCPSRDVHQA